MTWDVRRFTEHPADFHGRTVPEPATRSVWVCEPTAPAVVLGSAQPSDRIDGAAAAAAGIAVVRRHSGGGAVLVVPGQLLWVDVVLPAGDQRWHPDVGVAAHWVGTAWAAALTALGHPAEVHRGAMVSTAWSSDVCFAGLGPGEVRVHGRKVVGISQRRTRGWVRFQCAALRQWDPVTLVELLALEPAQRAVARQELAVVAAGVAVDAEVLLATLVTYLS